MAQKFSSLEEAAQQLGISKERLTELREAGKVRGYRDGASWKFRSDEIERLSEEGVPTLDPSASDIDLGSGLSLGLDSGIDIEKSPAESGLDLDLEELPSAAASVSDLELDTGDAKKPSEPADESEGVLAIDDDDELLDLSDSILLSEKDLGGGSRPPSTIIGKADLDPDGDLDLTVRGDSQSAAASDVKLAATSDVLMAADDDSLDLEPPQSDNFQGLAEVDVDLEAESSRVLSSGDTSKGKSAGKAKAAPPPSSDLSLAASSSMSTQPASDVDLGGSQSGGGSDLTGLSALELADDLDADQVLGEGSDITLSSASSGINIISPSDSGLALDEVALSSASMSSPLDLGESEEMTLEPLELSDDAADEGEPFQLTPLGEVEDEEKDSSQIIALDDISEEESEGVTFEPQTTAAVAGGEDFGAPMGFVPGAAPVLGAVDDVAMSGPVFAMLTCGLLLLLVSGMMMFDLVRNIWSWDGVAPLNSTLIEVVNPLL